MWRLTSERVDRRRVLHWRHERFEVEKRRGRGPAERAELVLVVQTVPAHGGQLPALGHEHDEQHERGRGAQAQRQAPVLVARLRGPQSGHGPADAQRRRAADGQPYVHGLAIVVPYVPRLDGQHGDGQQQTGRVHHRAEHVLVLGVTAVVQAARPLQQTRYRKTVFRYFDFFLLLFRFFNTTL